MMKDEFDKPGQLIWLEIDSPGRQRASGRLL